MSLGKQRFAAWFERWVPLKELFFKYGYDSNNSSETSFRGGCATMRIEKTDARETKWSNLKEATGKGHTSKALDVAADYYIRMRGETTAVPRGQLTRLLEAARDEGSLTAEEIAAILNTEQLPIEAEVTIQVGEPE